MSSWNISPAQEVLGEPNLSLVEAQELLLATYCEEQDKWNKDVLNLEQSILALEKALRELMAGKDKWWERALSFLRFRHKTLRQEQLNKLQAELDRLHALYLKRIVEQPVVDRYELGMFCGKLFKGK